MHKHKPVCVYSFIRNILLLAIALTGLVLISSVIPLMLVPGVML